MKSNILSAMATGKSFLQIDSVSVPKQNSMLRTKIQDCSKIMGSTLDENKSLHTGVIVQPHLRFTQLLRLHKLIIEKLVVL